MISNDRPSPYGHHHHNPRSFGQPRPPVNEDTLKTDKVQIERKTFITEDVGGRRDTIIIPAPGLEDFKRLLDDMVKTAAETPPPADKSE
jgi:hypothetical protein